MSVQLHTSNLSASLPSYIEHSWKRCQSKGLQPSKMEKENILSEYELIEFKDQYEELIYYASPILKDVYHTTQGAEFLILIASPEGYIIDSHGDTSFLSRADKVALRKGANWLEESRGTNAIGTAIVEKKPILVHGNQHYCIDNHFLTCAAAPILSSDGELFGILNISTHHHNHHPFILGLVKRAAHSIEQALLLANMEKQTEKPSFDLDFIYNRHPSSLITINKEGEIIRINHSASRTIGCSEQTALGNPISHYISGLDSSFLSSGQEKKISYKDQVFTTHMVTGEKHEQSCMILRGETLQEKSPLTNRYNFSDITCNDAAMHETISIAKRVAMLDINLLISGESGTGKELFSQSIHGASLRSEKPFIAINCSAIPESLLESELFGYEKGAFTGAKSGGQVGKFEAADNGTLFLDEIGDMPLAAQATLLRVLQERCVTRIGSITPRPINVRIIAATHKNLQKEIEEGRFRADLYFRISGFTLNLPALRNRSDLLMLAEEILLRLPFTNGTVELTEEAKRFITEYEWPGNFRQLQNVLQQAAFLSDRKPITGPILASLCPSSGKSINEEESSEQKSMNLSEQEPMSLREQEINLIKQVLERTNGNISFAAKQLNIGRNTLYRKMKAYGV